MEDVLTKFDTKILTEEDKQIALQSRINEIKTFAYLGES